MNLKAVQKYLEQHAESEASEAENLLRQPLPEIERCLVIPAFAESPKFVQRLIKTWSADAQLLVILVINRPEPCSEPDKDRANTCLEQIQKSLPNVEAQFRNLSWRKAPNCEIQFLLVDRCSDNPIPKDQGVGLARKIGCDIALKFQTTGQILSQWVHTTDADAYLPDDYFKPKLENSSAAVYSHRYLEAESKLYQATQIYDLRNRDYQQQLAKAGSGYAFNPTGSLLVLHLDSYAQVRGFPKRAGGEDFYLLNKMQKIRGVSEVQSNPVGLDCRLSDRVPFGTGPAVSKLMECEPPEKEKIFYHPRCFQVFAEGLAFLRRTHPEQWLANKSAPEEFKEALKEMNVAPKIKHLTPIFEKDKLDNAANMENYRYHFDLWFDAFQSLKTIHFLRDRYFPSISHDEWIAAQAN